MLRPVFWAAPWLKLVLMAAIRTPRPTWAGFVPPLLPCGAPAALSIWLRVSSKTVADALNPAVFTLAMLLPVTSIIVWCARRPLMPENRERSMGHFLWFGCTRQAVVLPVVLRTSVTEDSGTSVLPTRRVGLLPVMVADDTTPVRGMPSDPVY